MGTNRIGWWLAAAAALSAAPALAAGPDLDQGVDAKATLSALRASAKKAPQIKGREAGAKPADELYFGCRETFEDGQRVDRNAKEEEDTGQWGYVKLNLEEGKRLRVFIKEGSEWKAYSGTLDMPKVDPGYSRMIRFKGFDGMSGDYGVSLLMDRQMFAGKAGRLKLQARGETFSSATFACKPTPAPLRKALGNRGPK